MLRGQCSSCVYWEKSDFWSEQDTCAWGICKHTGLRDGIKVLANEKITPITVNYFGCLYHRNDVNFIIDE